MVTERERIAIELDPESELARAVVAAGRKPVAVSINGRRYLVRRDPDDLWDDDDEAGFEAALRAVVGTLSLEEGERLKEAIYRGREEGTRPLPKP
jgi:hypothetical protein